MTAFHKLTLAHRKSYRDHLLRLSQSDRAMRFQGSISDTGVIAHVEQIDFTRTVVIGGFADGLLIAAAELAFERFLLPRCAELALTVEEGQQGQGLGTELARRAVTIARNRGVLRLSMLCLSQNRRMQSIAKRLEGELVFEQGSVEACVTLQGATMLTMFSEAWNDGSGALLRFADRLKAAA